MAALIVLAVTLQHRVVAVRGGVVKGVVPLEIFHHLVGSRTVERATHAGRPESLRHLGMAARAGGGSNIAVTPLFVLHECRRASIRSVPPPPDSEEYGSRTKKGACAVQLPGGRHASKPELWFNIF